MKIAYRVNAHPHHYLETNEGLKYFLEPLPPQGLIGPTRSVNIFRLDASYQKKKVGTFDVMRGLDNEILMWFDALDYLEGHDIIQLPVLSKDPVISITKKNDVLSFKRYGQSEIRFDTFATIGISMDGALLHTFTIEDYRVYQQLMPLLTYCDDLNQEGNLISRQKLSDLLVVTPLLTEGLMTLSDVKKSAKKNKDPVMQEGPLLW